MVNGDNSTLHVKDGKYMVNDANIITSIRASNKSSMIDGASAPQKESQGKDFYSCSMRC
jgi:hypothetical protein